MKGPDWQWIITAGMAVYGALLSTYNAYVQRKQSKRQIVVTVTWGFLTYTTRLSELMLYIQASNPGHRPLTLTGNGFRLPGGRQAVLTAAEGTVQLPHSLTEGTSCTHWIPAREIKHELRASGFSGKVPIIGFYLDALGKCHVSKPFELDVNQPD